MFPVQSSEVVVRRAGGAVGGSSASAGSSGSGGSALLVRAGEEMQVVVTIKTPFGDLVTGPHVECMMEEIALLPEGVLMRTGEPSRCTETGTVCFPVRLERSGEFDVSAAIRYKGATHTIGRHTRVKVAPRAVTEARGLQMCSECEGKDRELEALRWEVQQLNCMLGSLQEQTVAVLRVQKERQAACDVTADKLKGELLARSAELAELRGAATARGRELEELAGKVRQAEELLGCSICMERLVTTVFNPCGHCYCCEGDCPSGATDSCFTCLQPVVSKTRLFLG